MCKEGVTQRMAILNTQRALTAAPGDGEFKIAARYWDADLRLEAGDEKYLLRVRNGMLLEFRELQAIELESLRPAATISASRDDWIELLKPVPRPFFQDLMVAATRQGFKDRSRRSDLFSSILPRDQQTI